MWNGNAKTVGGVKHLPKKKKKKGKVGQSLFCSVFKINFEYFGNGSTDLQLL